MTNKHIFYLAIIPFFGAIICNLLLSFKAHCSEIEKKYVTKILLLFSLLGIPTSFLFMIGLCYVLAKINLGTHLYLEEVLIFIVIVIGGYIANFWYFYFLKKFWNNL